MPSYLINALVAQLVTVRDILAAHSMVHIGLDAAGGDNVDGDLLVAEVDGHAAGEGLDGALAAGVDGVLGDALGLAGDAAHEDEAAPFLEVEVGLLGDEELAPRVDGEDAVELLGRDVLDVPERHHAAVGAHDVQLAEDPRRPLEQRLDLAHVRHVGLDRRRVRPRLLDLLHHLLGRLRAVRVVHDHLRAAASELEGHFPPDTAAYARRC